MSRARYVKQVSVLCRKRGEIEQTGRCFAWHGMKKKGWFLRRTSQALHKTDN